MSGKVVVPTSNIATIWTPMFEWYVVRCVSKIEQQKDKCGKEIGLHAQNMLIILGSTCNMVGYTSGLYRESINANMVEVIVKIGNKPTPP
jgi:hypothetical protein